MVDQWIPVNDRLPQDGERVLAWVPNNNVYLPGKSGEMEHRPCIILRFLKDFFRPGTEKRDKFGPHFWQGEGQSNHFFEDVSHWQPMPEGPGE